MAISFSSSDDIIIPTVNAQSYLGGAGNDTYILSSTTVAAGATIVIQDTEGSNRIQLAGGLEISSSQVAGNAVELTLSNAAKVQILGADDFDYDVGGNVTAGIPGTALDFSSFVPDTLGTTVPGQGESPSEGGAVEIPIDAGTGDIIFQFNAESSVQKTIQSFEEGDVLSFQNAPTGSSDDFTVDQAAWDDGEAQINVGEAQVTLVGLANDYFSDATSFQGIFGQDALVFA
jgi:hypothetical protein